MTKQTNQEFIFTAGKHRLEIVDKELRLIVEGHALHDLYLLLKGKYDEG